MSLADELARIVRAMAREEVDKVFSQWAEATALELRSLRDAVAAASAGAPIAVVTTEEAAARLRVSVSTVRRWVRWGHLRGVGEGKTLRVDLASMKFPPREPPKPQEPRRSGRPGGRPRDPITDQILALRAAGRSPLEIAEALGRPHKSVKNALARHRHAWDGPIRQTSQEPAPAENATPARAHEAPQAPEPPPAIDEIPAVTVVDFDALPPLLTPTRAPGYRRPRGLTPRTERVLRCCRAGLDDHTIADATGERLANVRIVRARHRERWDDGLTASVEVEKEEVRPRPASQPAVIPHGDDAPGDNLTRQPPVGEETARAVAALLQVVERDVKPANAPTPDDLLGCARAEIAAMVPRRREIAEALLTYRGTWTKLSRKRGWPHGTVAQFIAALPESSALKRTLRLRREGISPEEAAMVPCERCQLRGHVAGDPDLCIPSLATFAVARSGAGGQ